MNEEIALQAKLGILGECVPLKLKVELDAYANEIAKYTEDWRPYNQKKPDHRRFGLSLTSIDGTLGGPDLDSIYEYNQLNNATLRESSFREPTKILRDTSCFAPLRDNFSLGRTHLIRFDKGGFFPPHRDSFGLAGECFRLICPLQNATWNQLAFVLNDRLLRLNQGQFYLLDTAKIHSVFSYVDNSVLLVANVLLSEPNYKAVIAHLETI